MAMLITFGLAPGMGADAFLPSPVVLGLKIERLALSLCLFRLIFIA